MPLSEAASRTRGTTAVALREIQQPMFQVTSTIGTFRASSREDFFGFKLLWITYGAHLHCCHVPHPAEKNESIA